MFSLWYNRFMDKKYEKISQDLGVTLKQIDIVLSLTAEGATIPFIARYRKDMTGSLDEVAIKAIIDLDKSLTNLNDRKEAVLAKIQEQGKLTKELEEAILAAEKLADVEELYLPYKEMRTAADKYLSKDSIQITNENYMEVMEAIYDYPDEFEGKTVQFTGFVYNDPSHANSQFLFRFGIIHCIADSGVYGLLTKGNTRQYENNTWITAKGKLVNHYHKELKQNLPTLEIDSFTKVDKPENPYVYRVF
jgi:uncharacterized repeat protein (TIGR03943 family)